MVDDLGTIKLWDFGFFKHTYSKYRGCEENKDPNQVFTYHESTEGAEQTHTLKPLPNSLYYWPPEVHLGLWSEYDTSYDIWSLGCTWYEMLTGWVMLYDFNDPSSLRLPIDISDQWADFINSCLNFDPSKRSTIDDLVAHDFLSIQETQYKKTQEAINFMPLYSLVATNDNFKPNPQVQSNTTERLTILQKKNKYKVRDSTFCSYKIVPELSNALGLARQDSLNHTSHNKVTLNFEDMKRYSRSSIMINALTGYANESVSISQKSEESNKSSK